MGSSLREERGQEEVLPGLRRKCLANLKVDFRGRAVAEGLCACDDAWLLALG